MKRVLLVSLGVAALHYGAASAMAAPSFDRKPVFRVYGDDSGRVSCGSQVRVTLTLFLSQRIRRLEVKIGRAGRYTALPSLVLDPASRTGTLESGYTFDLSCKAIHAADLVVNRSYRIVARASNRAGGGSESAVVKLRAPS